MQPLPLPRQPRPTPRSKGAARTIGMVLFGLIVAASAVVFGALAVHLVPILEATGLALRDRGVPRLAQGRGAGGGPHLGPDAGPQVAPDRRRPRLRRLPAAVVPRADAGRAPNFSTALAFTLLFGISNGLVTIMRGAVPLALFGAKGYGEVLGILATPYLLLAAIAPAAFALVVERWGYGAGEAILLGAGLVSLLSMEVMALWYRRQGR